MINGTIRQKKPVLFYNRNIMKDITFSLIGLHDNSHVAATITREPAGHTAVKIPFVICMSKDVQCWFCYCTVVIDMNRNRNNFH